MNLGQTIQDIRKTKGMRQDDLATRCGISPTYLSSIENNRKEPLLSTMKLIAEALNVPLPILFFLAIDQNDIPESKRPVYETLAPAMRSLISEVFAVS